MSIKVALGSYPKLLHKQNKPLALMMESLHKYLLISDDLIKRKFAVISVQNMDDIIKSLFEDQNPVIRKTALIRFNHLKYQRLLCFVSRFDESIV